MKLVQAIAAVCMMPMLLMPIGAGCAAEEKETTTYDRSEEAMRDPFNYSPFEKRPSVSGGGIGELDREGLNRDVDHLINP